MAHDDDRRLIEDYLPIEAISAEARVENSVTQARGYLSKAGLSLLHRWWARRPLVACRAAVYAALVPAHQFQPSDCPPEKRVSLGRANAAKFVERLCQRNVAKADLDKASQHIRAANGGKAPRVLDMFAGGGSIPLEAARLGCEAHAVELNPVAHLVELATLVYPAEHGAELVEAVRRWSAVVRDRAEAEVGDLYPLLPDLYAQKGHTQQLDFKEIKRKGEAKGGDGGLRPVAYLWTRTVPCPNCGATVPLHRQTWLRKKAKGYVALRPDAKANKGVTYEL